MCGLVSWQLELNVARTTGPWQSRWMAVLVSGGKTFIFMGQCNGSSLSKGYGGKLSSVHPYQSVPLFSSPFNLANLRRSNSFTY